MFCNKKGGHFQTGEQGWVPLFPVSEGAGKRAKHEKRPATFHVSFKVPLPTVYTPSGGSKYTLEVVATLTQSVLPYTVAEKSNRL